VVFQRFSGEHAELLTSHKHHWVKARRESKTY
jgi:hypothetical protein